MTIAPLGRVYEDGEVIFRQGDVGDCLYVVEDGQVEIVAERDGAETLLRVAGPGELFGEMAIFDREARSATVRARGRARVLTLDKKHFLRRMNEDPSLAFQLVEAMSHRVRALSREVVTLRHQLHALGQDR